MNKLPCLFCFLDGLELQWTNFKHWFFTHLQWIADNWQNFEFAIVLFFLLGLCCGIAVMIILSYFREIDKKIEKFEGEIKKEEV